jgi:hypothetical protein
MFPFHCDHDVSPPLIHMTAADTLDDADDIAASMTIG